VASLKRFVRAVGRVLIWPLSRFFDPRFRGVASQSEAQHQDLVGRIEVAQARIEGVQARLDERHDQAAALIESGRNEILEAVTSVKGLTTVEMETATEATELIGRSLADLLGEVERLARQLEQIQQRLNEKPKETKGASP
jgi:chromosome segregation ATPase